MNKKVPQAPINRKPPQSRVSNPRERLDSAKHQQPNSNRFKQKDEQLLNMVKQFLLKNGYNKSLEILKNERPVRRMVSSSLAKSYEEENKYSNLIQAFDKGAREQFFRNSEKLFNCNDQDIKKLEFELHIYFCIYAIHPIIRKANSIDKNSLDAFKKYIENKGADLSKTNEFLSFYALPYISKPQQHPALSHVFTKDWIQKLRQKLIDFIGHIKPNNIRNNMKALSSLQELFYHSQDQTNREGICKQNCQHLIEVRQARNHNKQLLNYIDIIQNHYKKFTQSSKSNLFQSNVKWFQFSKQLFSLIKRSLKGQKIDKLQKYEAFFSKSVEELIYGTNDISLFEKNSYITEQVSSITPVQIMRNGQNKKFQANLVCQIDLDKIAQFFKQSFEGERQIKLCLVLKALKDRFMKLKSPYARREIIISYSRHDICGIQPQNEMVRKNLLLNSSQKVKEFYLRLLNYITTDFYGISYLSSSQKLIEKIIELFGSQNEMSVCRKYVLGILQRFSLLKKPQSTMISFGIIPMIFRIFRSEKDQLSQYSRHYLTAMIMNLSLRRSSRTHFQKCKGELISILLSNIDSEDPMTKDYVNGALYSLIQSSSLIRQQAIRQQTLQKIQHLLSTIVINPDENEVNMDLNILKRQYQYILDALAGQCDMQEQSVMTDSQQQDMELDDIDEQQQDDLTQISEDIQEYIEGQFQHLTGEQLLMKQFALLGPEAIREQMLTRSLLDETSKRVQNMTASINRSRRIDNIFSQRPITPSLLPDLDYSINPTKI